MYKKEEDMFRISIQGAKGGVGKSTIALGLARELALNGREVLFIDRDLLGFASFLAGIREYGLLAKAVEGRGPLPLREIRMGRGTLTVLKLFGDGMRFKSDMAVIHADPALRAELEVTYREILGKRSYHFAVVDNLPLVTPSDDVVRHELEVFRAVYPSSQITRIFVSDSSRFCINDTMNYVRVVESSPDKVGFPGFFVINMIPPFRDQEEYLRVLREAKESLGTKGGVLIPFLEQLFQIKGGLESFPTVPQIRRMALNLESGTFEEFIN